MTDPNRPATVVDPAAVTPELVRRVLYAAGRLGSQVRVSGLRVSPMPSSGLVGSVDRILIDYSEPCDAPTSLIRKYPSPAFADSRRFALTEASFYAQRLPERSGIRTPQVYHCGLDESESTSLLLLQDLGDRGFVRQIDGCGPAQALAVIEHIAVLHGSWWHHQDDAALSWLHTPQDSDVTAFCRRWLRAYPGRWPAELGRLPAVLAAELDSIAQRLSTGSSTLVHGDFHSQNLSFDGAAERPSVTVIDFQFVQRSTGMFDVARFLATSLLPEVRRELQDRLIEHYLGCLAEQGITDYSLEQCHRELRLALLWNLATPIALHVMDILTNDKAMAGTAAHDPALH